MRVALVQTAARPTPREAADLFEQLARSAAAQDARIVCSQELFLSPYFCRTQDPAAFELAEPVPGPTVRRFQYLASELDTVLILSLFEKRAPGLYHNTAAVIDADGSFLGSYRKMHIPQDPGFEEKFYFTPGDTPFRSWNTRHGRIGVIICWDQWFPEAARLTALAGAEIVFCPTAIGVLAGEDPALGAAQLHAWRTVQQGHAIANGCFFAAVNRVGTEEPIRFWGSSFVADFHGNLLASAPADTPALILADCDLAAIENHRRMWPFFRDRRVDAYAPLIQRFHDA